MSSKLGRPTEDPCERYVAFIPKSIQKDLEPVGMESQSKRITHLVKLGIKQEKRMKKK